MEVVLYSVVQLGIFLLFQSALASKEPEPHRCESDLYGRETEFEIDYGKSILQRWIRSFTVYIPDGCNGFTAGVKVIACDYDVAPNVRVISNSKARVTRRGSLKSDGYVTAIVYCIDDSYPDYSLAAHKELLVEADLDSRRAFGLYRRPTRSSDNTQEIFDQDQSQASLDAYRSTQSSDTRQENRQEAATLTTSRNTPQILNKAHYEAEQDLRRSNEAAGTTQSTNAVHKALAEHIHQVALKQADHQTAQKSRLDEQTSETRHQAVNKRLRRALQTSDTSHVANPILEAKADKAHQVTINQALRQSTHKTSDADQVADTQRHSEQKRSRLDSQSSGHNHQEAEERDGSLEEIASRTLTRHQISQTTEPRQAVNAVREALGDNSRQTVLAQASLLALNKARQAAQLADARQANDIVRGTLEDNALQVALTKASLQAFQEAASRITHKSNSRQVNNASSEAVTANKQNNVDRDRILAAQEANRDTQVDYSSSLNNNALRKELANKARQGALNQERYQVIQDMQRSSYPTRALDTHYSTEVVRQVLGENGREAALSLAQAINKAVRTPQTSQLLDNRQSNNALRENARQVALNQAHQQALLEARLRSRRASHSSEISQAADSSRDTQLDKAHQPYTIKQKAQLAEQKTNIQSQEDQKRSRRSSQFSSNNRQTADIVEKALAAKALEHALDALNERRFTSQWTDSRLMPTTVRDALTPYQRQAYERARFQIFMETSRSGKGASSQQSSEDVLATGKARENYFDQTRRQAFNEGREIAQIRSSVSNERQSSSDQTHLQTTQQIVLDKVRRRSDEVRQNELGVDTRRSTDAVRGTLTNKAHQAALEQAHRQALGKTRKSAQTDDARRTIDAQQQAALLAEETSRSNNQLLAAYSRYY